MSAFSSHLPFLGPCAALIPGSGPSLVLARTLDEGRRSGALGLGMTTRS